MAEVAVLEINGLKKYFDGLKAVDGVDLTVRRGEILGLIGPNGAGKTTLFNTVCGAYRPTAGRILLGGREIQGLPAHRVARLGVARTFQITHVFRDMTVLDNVLAAMGQRHFASLAGALKISHTAHNIAEAASYLEQVELTALAHQRTGSLSLGSLRRLELARALALRPALLMLDEPCAGIGAEATADFCRLISDIKAAGATIMLVEHNMAVATSLCDRMVVLNYGRKIAEGSPAEVQSDPQVIAAYLGEEEDGHAAD